MPDTSGGRWLSRASAGIVHRLPHAPAFGSCAPKNTRPIRELTIAPAHIAHGSSVTASEQSDSRQAPRARPASRIATSSAWPVGSPVVSRSFACSATTLRPR